MYFVYCVSSGDGDVLSVGIGNPGRVVDCTAVGGIRMDAPIASGCSTPSGQLL